MFKLILNFFSFFGAGGRGKYFTSLAVNGANDYAVNRFNKMLEIMGDGLTFHPRRVDSYDRHEARSRSPACSIVWLNKRCATLLLFLQFNLMK